MTSVITGAGSSILTQTTGESADRDYDIENMHSPFVYNDECPLPPQKPGQLTVAPGIHYRSFISKDCEWGWRYNQAVIQAFPISHDLIERKNKRTFNIVNTEPLHFPAHHFISCTDELKLHNKKLTAELTKLVIGLNIRNISGGIVIFCPVRAQPLKYIAVPKPVTSIKVLSHYEEGGCSGASRHFYNEAMMTMVGVVAVGLVGGEVLIVDLALDHYKRTCHELSKELNTLVMARPPYQIAIVNPHERNIVGYRRDALDQNLRIAVRVKNESQSEMDVDDENEPVDFEYCNPDEEIIQMFPRASVKVTALHYIPCTGLLAVGFSFGGFQVWRMDALQLCHSSMIGAKFPNNGVFGFSFSQPIDDPRDYSYLWVMYGRASLEMGESHVELHLMEFEEKPHVERVGFLYKDLKQVTQRMSFRLEDFYDKPPQPQSDDSDSSDDEQELGRYRVRPLKIWDDPKNPNLTFFSWECHRVGMYYVGIFDLNQWYSSQMIEFFRFNPFTKLCPYWVAIPCEINSADKDTTSVFDLQLSPKSCSKYFNQHLKLDIHNYPASLSFEMAVLTQTGLSTFRFWGLQEKLLKKFMREHQTLMIQPCEIKNAFVNYGLCTVLDTEYDDAQYNQEDKDRLYILSVLFDHQRNHVITMIAASWLDDSQARFGCTIDLILEWIASLSWGVRIAADEHWKALYTMPLELLSVETRHFINYSNFVWKSIHGVFKTLTRPDIVYWNRERLINDVDYGLTKFVSYSAALLMMMNGEVLPEKIGSDILKILSTHHEQRRNDVLEALNDCEHLDPEMKKVKPMMIDYLLEVFDESKLRQEWALESSDLLYPPKHIGAILNMLLWVEDPKAVGRVISYLILDLRNVAQVEARDHLSGDFLAVIQLTREEQAEVYNLWLLDQGKPEDVLRFMSTKSKHEDPWESAYFIATAMGKEQQVIGNLARGCTLALSKLYLNLLSRYPRRFWAYCWTSDFKSLCQYDEFLANFFKLAEECGLLGEFITTHLRPCGTDVRDALIEYLKGEESFENDDRLLAIYSQEDDLRHLINDQYTKMLKLYGGKLSEIQRHRWAIRECLVKQILNKRSNDVMSFLRKSGSVPKKPERRAPLVIHAKQAPSLPQRAIDSDAFCKVKLPPHLRHLNEAQPSSPLRHYVPPMADDTPDPKKARRKSMAARMSIIFNSSVANFQIAEEDEEMREEEALNTPPAPVDKETSFRCPMEFNLTLALKPPSVDAKTRQMRKSLPLILSNPAEASTNFPTVQKKKSRFSLQPKLVAFKTDDNDVTETPRIAEDSVRKILEENLEDSVRKSRSEEENEGSGLPQIIEDADEDLEISPTADSEPLRKSFRSKTASPMKMEGVEEEEEESSLNESFLSVRSTWSKTPSLAASPTSFLDDGNFEKPSTSSATNKTSTSTGQEIPPPLEATETSAIAYEDSMRDIFEESGSNEENERFELPKIIEEDEDELSKISPTADEKSMRKGLRSKTTSPAKVELEERLEESSSQKKKDVEDNDQAGETPSTVDERSLRKGRRSKTASPAKVESEKILEESASQKTRKSRSKEAKEKLDEVNDDDITETPPIAHEKSMRRQRSKTASPAKVELEKNLEESTSQKARKSRSKEEKEKAELPKINEDKDDDDITETPPIAHERSLRRQRSKTASPAKEKLVDLEESTQSTSQKQRKSRSKEEKGKTELPRIKELKEDDHDESAEISLFANEDSMMMFETTLEDSILQPRTKDDERSELPKILEDDEDQVAETSPIAERSMRRRRSKTASPAKVEEPEENLEESISQKKKPRSKKEKGILELSKIKEVDEDQVAETSPIIADDKSTRKKFRSKTVSPAKVELEENLESTSRKKRKSRSLQEKERPELPKIKEGDDGEIAETSQSPFERSLRKRHRSATATASPANMELEENLEESISQKKKPRSKKEKELLERPTIQVDDSEEVAEISPIPLERSLRKRNRSGSYTPSPAKVELEESLEESFSFQKKTKSRSKKLPLIIEDDDDEVPEISPIPNEKSLRKRNRSNRSKTASPAKSELEENLEDSISSQKKPKPRSKKEKRTLQLPKIKEDDDEVPEISPIVDERPLRRRYRSKASPVKIETAEEDEESSFNLSTIRSLRSTRSKTPSLASSVTSLADDDEPSTSKNKTSTAKPKARSRQPSAKDRLQVVKESTPTPSPKRKGKKLSPVQQMKEEALSSDEEQEEERPRTRAMRRLKPDRRVFGFAPDLSTVAESSMTDRSLIDATLVSSFATSPPPPTLKPEKSCRSPRSKSNSKEEAEADAVSISPKTKRTRRAASVPEDRPLPQLVKEEEMADAEADTSIMTRARRQRNTRSASVATERKKRSTRK